MASCGVFLVTSIKRIDSDETLTADLISTLLIGWQEGYPACRKQTFVPAIAKKVVHWTRPEISSLPEEEKTKVVRWSGSCVAFAWSLSGHVTKRAEGRIWTVTICGSLGPICGSVITVGLRLGLGYGQAFTSAYGDATVWKRFFPR